MTSPAPPPYGPEASPQKWAWAHLSLTAVADLPEALALVRGMTPAQRLELLEAALTTQATLLPLDKASAYRHEQVRFMWGSLIVGAILPRDEPW